jgi:hypothetical protein
MFSLITIGLFLCCLNSWTNAATPYKDCGSESGMIQAFEVTDCTAAPCKFMKGNTYAMNLTFQAKAPSNTATVTIFGRLKLDRVRVHAHIDETSFFQ